MPIPGNAVGSIRALIVLVAAAASAGAAPIVSSTFDSDADGWIVGSFLTPSGTTATPTYVASGGNPGGHLRVDDFTPWTAYQAPAKFRGDLSVAYGALLRFDVRVPGVDALQYAAIVISNGTTTLEFRETPTVGGWYRFEIPLLASAGWQHSTNAKSSNTGATELQMQAVLSNIQFLHINADWLTGMDYAELDNVMIETIPNPEPSTMLLLGTAMVAFIAWGRGQAKTRSRRS
jgi:hypothetical protein